MKNPIEDKLKEIFDTSEKAAKIVENHRGQSFDQIKKSVDLNISAHVSASNHVGLFVYNVMNKKGDLATLADAAAKRIVLSDSRIELAFQKLSLEEKAKKAEEIYAVITKELTSYFQQLKGKSLDQGKMIETLTTVVVKKIAENLGHFERM